MYHSPHSAGLWLHLKLSWELHYLKRMEEAWYLPRQAIFFLEHANKIIADCDVAVDKMQELSSNGGEIDIGYVFPLASNMKRGTASVWCCSFFVKIQNFITLKGNST